MDYLIPDRLYNVIKWVGLILCPALALLVGRVGHAWGYDAAAVVETINAVGVFVGALIGVSQIAASGKSDFHWEDE